MKTFNEWLDAYTKEHGTPPAHVMAEAAWNCQQAEIDRLMIEFCPDEITPLQWKHWEAAQAIYIDGWADKYCTGDSDLKE